MLYILIINLILKLPMIFINVVPSDVLFYWSTGQLFFRGYIPYKDFNMIPLYDYTLALNIIHPNGPFNYIFYSFIELILGNSTFAIKFPMLIAEISASILLFQIGKIILGEKKGFLLALLYTTCPISYYPMILIGCDEIVSGAFVLGSIYFLLKNKNIFSGILLALSVTYKLYSIFLLIPILIYYFGIKNYKNMIYFIISFSLTALAICLPYLLLCFNDFLHWNLFQANRFITISFGKFLKNSLIYRNIVTSNLFNISVMNLFQLSIVGIFTALLWRKMRIIRKSSRQHKKINHFNNQKRELILLLIYGSAFFTVILPILSLSTNYRYFFWSLPFILLTLFRNVKLKEERFIRSIFFIIIVNSIILVLITIFAIFQFPIITPFSITYIFNSYIILFFILFSAWGIYFLTIFSSSKNGMLFIIGSLFTGFADLFAYIALHWENDIKYLFASEFLFIVSFLFVLAATIAFLYVISSNYSLKRKNMIKKDE